MKYLKIYTLAVFFSIIALFSKAQNIITIHYIDQIDSIGKNAPGYPDSGNYVLDRDLDFNNPDHYSNGIVDAPNHTAAPGWHPIYFKGTFNGQKHTIKNVYINNVGIIGVNASNQLSANYDNPDTYLSFFSIIDELGTVKNLYLLNINYSTPNIYFGALQIATGAGFVGLNRGKIENCGVDGQVNIDFASGGFVQTNIGTISGCYARIYFANTSFKNDRYTNYRLGSNGGFVCLNAGLIQNSFSAPTYNSTVNEYKTFFPTQTNPGAFVGMAEGWYNSPATYRYGGRTSLIKNCYTINNQFSFASVLLPGSRFDSSYSSYLFNPIVYDNSTYTNTIAGVLNNCVANADTLTSLAPLGNSPAYKFVQGYPPILYELNTQNVLKLQIDTFKVKFKYPNGNIVEQNNYLYDSRSKKSDRITPPEGYGLDSVFVNDVFYTKDSVYGIKLLDFDNISNVVVNLGNPIKLIRTVEDLDSIGKYPQYLNTGAYLLANDIDFLNPLNYSTGVVNTLFTTGLGFTPINNFKGVFYGNNFKIKNLYINQPSLDSVGLFNTLDGAYIDNLIITNANITGNNTVGILASYTNNTNILNCYVSGNIVGKNNVGGLIGINKNGIIINSISKVKIIGDSILGGMVGINSHNSEIKNSFTDANLTANKAGGLFAGINESSSIIYCYAWGTIAGGNDLGALIYKNGSNGAISYCYSVVKNKPVNYIDISTLNNYPLVTGVTLKYTNFFLTNYFLLEPGYHLPYIYKYRTKILLDSQYMTKAQLNLYKDSLASVKFPDIPNDTLKLNYLQPFVTGHINTNLIRINGVYYNLGSTNFNFSPLPLSLTLKNTVPGVNFGLNMYNYFVLSGNGTTPIGNYKISIQAANELDTQVLNIQYIVTSTPIVFSYTIDSVSRYIGADSSVRPNVNNTGYPIKFKIISGGNDFIKIDSNTGVIKWTNKLVSGIYRLTIQAADTFGFLNKSYTINILPYPNNIYQTNSVYTSNQNGGGANGDYINLPTLNIDSVYTVETWFKLNNNTGTIYPFIYSFGGWNNGLIMDNTLNRTLRVKSWGTEAGTSYNLTAGTWVHLAVVVNGRNTKIYANGNLVFNNTIFTPTINNQWLSNRIGNGQAAGNISTTLGSFKDFRIWKVARPIDSIKKYKDTFVNENDTNLYYYLPLTSSTAQNIANGTILNNYAISAKANTNVSTINSIAVQYSFDPTLVNTASYLTIYGSYTDTLIDNEIIQYNIDNGITWIDLPAYNNRFKIVIKNFKGGNILVRSNLGNRVFNNINIAVAPTNFYYDRRRIDTFYNLAGETSIPNINKGGSLNLKFSLLNNVNSNISVDSNSGVIRWSELTDVGLYNIRVRASNEIGFLDTSIILYIYRPIFNEGKLFSNNSFQTTNIGVGGTGTGGDYIKLPTINLINTNYTFETWFKYNENTITTFKRIFDFGQSSTLDSSNILLCFKSGSTVTSPIMFFFAGNGQQAFDTVPASINIKNWNHYALVLKDSIASFYINGILLGTHKGKKATASYLRNFIGRSNDNINTTLGNWQDFRIWNKARSPQELKNYFKSRIIKYEDSFVYNLFLNGKYTSSIDYLVNGTKLTNNAVSKDAIIDSAIVTSVNNNGARFVFDSTNQKLFGTITDTLFPGDSIQINYDNGSNWVNVDSVVQNTWLASVPSNFIAGTIQIRGKLVNRNFNNYIVKIKPSYFTYSPNIYADLEGVSDSSNIPSIRASTPLNYILKTNKSGYTINNFTGRINWDTTIATTKDTLLVTAKNDIDSISTQVYVNIGDSVKEFSYSLDTLVTYYYTTDSSVLPLINGTGVKSYSIIGGGATGISINSTTGVIYVSNTVAVGTYNLTIQGRSRLNGINTKFVIKVLPNMPIISYADTFFTVLYNNVGTSNKPILNKTGVTNKFKIVSGNNEYIFIDSLTGEINNLSRLYNGVYNLQVEASNVVGADTTNFTINIVSYVDTVHGFYNTVLSKSFYAQARIGDYIALPTLDLKNTPYTIETWFKYNGTGPISSYIRIFDFNRDNPPSGAANSNILLCFNNSSSTDSPTLLAFAGNGQYTINVPANKNVKIRNWNHYALVYNASGTTARLYINGELITANIPALASTQDFLSNYIGASSDNSYNTIGSFKGFKIWKRALPAQEINDQYKTITNTFKNNLYYYLPLEKYNKTSQNIINNTQIYNASTAIGANPNYAIIKSIGDTSAKFVIDTNNNIVFGNIKDSLNVNEFIQVNFNNDTNWHNATVINNNWYYKANIKGDINQINVRGYDSLNGIISRTFNTLIIENKIKNLTYLVNSNTLNYKNTASSVQPTYNSSSTVKFKLLNNPFPNSIVIDSNLGVINIKNNTPVGMYILDVQASSLYDTVITTYTVTILGIKPSGLSYPNNIISYYAYLINARPLLNETGGLNVKYTMLNAPTGVIIDSNTGVITATNDIQGGIYKIQVNVTNEIGYDSSFFNFEFKSFKDTIFGFLANTTQLTTNASNQNGDKIILPNLNLDSSYTVETWFNLDPNTGANFPFIYALGGWNNGLIFNNQSGNNRSLIVKSWGVEANGGANPATGIIIQPNVWNHYTVVVNGRNTKIFINGQLRREYQALGVPINNNLFLSNKLGTGEDANLNLSTTLGKYKEFKIWKKARTAAEISANFTNQHILFDTNLYYFLPLSNSVVTQNIPNNTTINGVNPLNTQNVQNATIISVNNAGAKYKIDTFNRKLYGTIKNPLANNEILQYTLDGQNWNTITEWEGSVWTVIVPNTFKFGIINVRSIIDNIVTNRVFNTIPYYLVADTPTNVRVIVDNYNYINVRYTPPIFKGGFDTISNYKIILKQGNSITNFTTKDTNYIIKNILDNTNYQVQIAVTNAVGTSDTTTSISVNTYPSQTLTTSSTGGGFIEISKLVKYGVNYRVTFQPFTGYKVDSLFIDNQYTPIADTSTGVILQNFITNHTVRVVFARSIYTIQTLINDNGAISSAANVYYGDSVVVTYSPNNGYKIDSIFIDGVYNPSLSTSKLNTYTFKDINISHTFKVVITIIKFRINANISSGGIINKNILANYGSNYQVTYSIKPGYTFDSLFVNDIYVPDSINSYTFTNILGDSSISIKLKLIIYNIGLNIVNGGTVTPNKDTTITVIDTITYNFINENNLYIDSVIVNGVNQLNSKYYIFKNTTSNQTLKVVFKSKPANTSNIEANVLTDGGTITPSGNIFVPNDSSQQFSIANNPGYIVDKIWVNNTKVDSTNSYTFYNVTGDSSIQVYFKIDTFIITTNYNNGGSINPAGFNKITYFDSLVYTITPNIGYYLDSLFIDNNLITNLSSYTFKNILKNTSIRGVFKQKTFIIRTSKNDGGNISSTGIDTVLYGTNIAYQITANEGYYLDSLIVDDVNVTKTNQYNFLNVIANHSLKAVFKKNKYTITAIALANGKINPSGDTILFYNDAITYTITPNIGYNIENILLDGVPININNNTLTLQNIRAGHTIQASFIIKKFTINITKGLNGQTSPPASSIQINYGADTNILIIPNNGYLIDTLIIDGIITPAKSLIEFTNVQVNHTIYVTFKIVPIIIKTYTISASSSNGGVISPAGTSVVNSGNNISYTITPNNGYLLDSLIVDDIKVTNATTYTFSNVTTNHTIKAVFKIDCDNQTKRTPVIVRTNNNLGSDLTFASYTWYKDGVLQTTLNNNLYTPSVAGVYTLMGTENTTCLSNLSKKYYYASTCITPTGRVGNGAYIQGNILGDNNVIIVKWCSEILQDNIIIRVIDLTGVLLNEQTIPANLGTYIINKQSIKSKQYLIQVIDSKGELLQISDVIN